MKSLWLEDQTLSLHGIQKPDHANVGSRCGSFAPALHLIERGEVTPTILIAGRYQLANTLDAMTAAQKPGIL